MSFVSFEQVLRDLNGIYWVRSRGGVTVHSGNRSRRFLDDAFGSVAGVIARRAFQLYPEYAQFPLSPLVQSFDSDALDFVRDFDVDGFWSRVVSKLPVSQPADSKYHNYYDDAVSNYRRAANLVVEDPVRLYSIVNSIHALLVLMRSDDDLNCIDFGDENAECPVIVESEYHLFFSGLKRGTIASPVPLHDAVLAAIKTMYGHFSLDDDKCRVVFRQFDPFKIVNSSFVEVPLDPFDLEEGSAPSVADSVEEISCDFANCKIENAVITKDDPAIQHLERYFGTDIDRLDAAERILAYFGTPAGKSLWDSNLNSAKENRLKKLFPQDECPILDWVGRCVSFFHEHTRFVDGDDVLKLLAAGFLVRNSNYFEVEFSPPRIIRK